MLIRGNIPPLPHERIRAVAGSKSNKTKFKNLKYEFNKGLNQLRNMPNNMR